MKISKPTYLAGLPLWALVIMVLFGLLFLLAPTEKKVVVEEEEQDQTTDYPFCDSEHILWKHGSNHFHTGKFIFRNGYTQSPERAHSGLFSSRTTPVRKYGMAYRINATVPGEEFEIVVWRNNLHHKGILAIETDWGKYLATDSTVEKGSEGWEKLSLRFVVPPESDSGGFRAYTKYTPRKINGVAEDDGSAVFFDDFSIRKVQGATPIVHDLRPSQMDSIQLLRAPIEGFSVKPYLESTGISTIIKVGNFYLGYIEVLGIGGSPSAIIRPASGPTMLQPNGYTIPPRMFTLSFPANGKNLYYKIPDHDSVYAEPIIPWSFPVAHSPRQELFSAGGLKSNSFCSVQGERVEFRSGVHDISTDVLIPSGLEVRFPPGCTLRFQDGARFISFSPVQMKGTDEAPIFITSPDSSAKAFSVMQAGDTSWLAYVTFDHFTTLEYKGWNLTGAVNFYDSPVVMDHCVFQNNHCEDGLNLIRTTFRIKNSEVKNTPFDGLDADFCTGELIDCQLNNTGNDGLDLSGSEVTVRNCRLWKIGDKGISVGEESTIKVEGISITGAIIGMASKDLSRVEIKDISLSNCYLGFALYQKKPEYGPAQMKVEQLEAANLRLRDVVQTGSVLELDGVKIKGAL